ncbi:MAG TPA: alpha/beta hydrolase [Solirubrobacterales bacterium]|nr:alpha/beta hydrolase [Solirubrobacterales bacterium]
MAVLEARGVEIAWQASGEGRPVLLIHETAVTAAIWKPLAEAVSEGARAIAYDRRGWGSSTAPDGYQRTTIEEQSEDAASLLESATTEPSVLCGAGVGAVIALDLLLRRPELVTGAVLIEPPLLGLLPAATQVLSDDRVRLHEALASGGAEEAVRLYLSGALEALGPGIGRLDDAATSNARERPAVLFAELGATAAWSTPFSRLTDASRRSLIVTAPSTPLLVRDAAAALEQRLAGSAVRDVDSGVEAPYVGAPTEVAEAILGLNS